MAALSPTATTAQHRDAPPLWKRIVSMVLLVIFGLSAILSVSAIWTNNQINDTDRYVRTVAPLASNPAIQQDLARTISLRLSKRLNDLIDTELTGDRAQLLAVPLSSAVNQYVESIVLEIVSSPQFEQLWTEIQRAAHTVVSAVLTGTNSDAITSKDGEIVLDLRPLVDQVIAQIKARGLDIVDRIPTDQIDTTFVIFQSDDLANVQSIVKPGEQAGLHLSDCRPNRLHRVSVAGHRSLACGHVDRHHPPGVDEPLLAHDRHRPLAISPGRRPESSCLLTRLRPFSIRSTTISASEPGCLDSSA